MAGAKQRIEQQPAWVLHTYPWRETSLIVEIFAREFGRVALVAKGARRPPPSCAACCSPSSRYGWTGRAAARSRPWLRAEWQGGQPLLTGVR